MSLVSGIAVYFVLWWLCLFVVLPFGVRNQEEMGEVTFGTERGAPHRPMLAAKAAATTLLAAVLFAGFYLFFNVYDLRLEDLIR